MYPVCTGTISKESSDFPGYDQHKCCGDFWSGSGPEAWAQVIGYYDRLGSGWSYSPFSGSTCGDIYTMAPKTLDPVKKDPTTMKAKAFMEDIRSKVLRSCDNGKGSTLILKEHAFNCPTIPRQTRGNRDRVIEGEEGWEF